MTARAHLIITIVLLTALWAVPSLRAQEPFAGFEVRDTLRLTTPEELAQGFYTEALRQQQLGHHGDAYLMLDQALALNPDLVGALYVKANYEYGLGNPQRAEQLLRQAAQIDTANYQLQVALVSIYLQAGREEEAIAGLERMAARWPRKSELPLQLAEMYNQREDYDGVIRSLERVELLEGKSEEISKRKFRCYVSMGDEQRAFAEMQDLAEEYPNDVQYQVLIGDLLLDAGRADEAKATYDGLLAEHPGNINVLLSLATYYTQTDDEENYRNVRDQLLLNEYLNPEARFRFMQALTYSALADDADTTDIMGLFRKLMDMPQQDTQLAELCARFFITKDAPEADIRNVLTLMLTTDPECDLARTELLSRALRASDIDEVVRLCQTAVTYNSDNPVYYYYLGLGHYQQRHLQEALDVMRRGLSKTLPQTNLDMVVNMYAICGDILHQLGNDEEAFLAYDSCLLLRPREPMVLNNYAYYLALRGTDLQRAEQMSLLSNQEERRIEGHDNPTYLDTYAWVLFQQGRYDEALPVIERALALYGALSCDSLPPDTTAQISPDVLEHAGDIYIKIHRTDEALQSWQRAVELYADDPDTDPGERQDALQRLRNKIKRKKYINP